LIKEFLGIVHSKLSNFGADSIVIGQVFRQIAQWMCALAMDQLVLRNDLCTFEKAIQIKHNVTEIKDWFCHHDLRTCADLLEPLVQASHLMQSRKDEANLETLCGDLTSKLTSTQIVSILQHYTPPAGFEEATIDSDFIALISERLNQRVSTNAADSSVDETYLTRFDTTPFVYSDFQLDTLVLPSCLHLDQTARLI